MINQDWLWVLDFCVANKHAVANTLFQRNISTLITYSSGGNQTQIDYILVKRFNLKNIKDTKAISSQKWITQQKVLVCKLILSTKPVKPIRIPSRRKIWKLKDHAIREEFEQRVTMKCQTLPARVENGCKSIKNGLLEAADEIYGWTRGGCERHKETW